MSVKHPAKFTQSIINTLQDIVVTGIILDPFAGTGRIHLLDSNLFVPRYTIGVEIEPEWATLHARTIVGNALCLPFVNGCFDGVVTSPTYGNRLADNYDAKDASLRHSYRFDLGRKLHTENSGSLYWGEKYRVFHQTAWQEVYRVLRPGGQFIINIKDHIRNRVLQSVSNWHKQAALQCGFEWKNEMKVPVKGLRYGQNRDRVDHEWLYVFVKS